MKTGERSLSSLCKSSGKAKKNDYIPRWPLMNALIKKTARRFGTQPDKIKHVGVSALLVLGFYGVLFLVTENAAVANGLALGITLLIGLAKEVVDKYTGGHGSMADMIANFIGAVPVALFIWFCYAILPEITAAF